MNTIAATTTRTGLTVRSGLDPGSYPDGVKVSDAQMAALPLDRWLFQTCGDIPPVELETVHYRQNAGLAEAG